MSRVAKKPIALPKGVEIDIAEKEDGVESVSSLAGYEILSEGTSANSGSCLINLKSWKDRKHSAKEIIDDLQNKCKAI